MKHWRSIEELKNSGKTNKSKENSEFSLLDEKNSGLKASRRDFLKVLGYSVGYATLVTSCEKPINKAIPYLIKPEEIIPGEANYYASTYFDGSDYCSILVKTREGRPIKIEGNDLSSVTKGGTSARIQASVLSLYDGERLAQPLKAGGKSTWEAVDAEIIPKLKEISESKGEIVLLTSTIISPSTKSLIEEFVQNYPSVRVIYYDPFSCSAILQANEISFDRRVIPAYNFDKALTIVSFGADFLGTWISPVEFTKQYAQNRKIKNKKSEMSYHVHFEAGLSVTGSNADKRIQIKPSDELTILQNIYNSIARKMSTQEMPNVTKSSIALHEFCARLLTNKSKSLVVSGSNNIEVQLTVNAINHLLGNYGNTIDLNNPINFKQAVDQEMTELVSDLNDEKVKGIILHNVNPVYDYAEPEKFISGIEKTELSIAISQNLDETASIVDFVCPDNHYLESWNDAEPKRGFFSLSQPAIQKLFDTRQFQDSLLKWSGKEISFYDYLKEYWKNNLYPKYSHNQAFSKFWNRSLQDGILEIKNQIEVTQPEFKTSSLSGISGSEINDKGDFELILYEKVGIGNGRHANNPWLQELPDPITRVCWDNYVSISPSDAKKKDLSEGEIILINDRIEVPVLIQPGQAKGTISLAIGYGRKNAGLAGNNVGVNAFPFLRNTDTNERWSFVSIKKTNKKHNFAQTQTHHTMEGREFVKETSLKDYKKPHSETHKPHSNTLYPKYEYNGHYWAMAIDLNACTGCGNCVISCQAENNIPVVGKEEVKRVHEMHWIRIDRYYSEDENDPKVVFQPMLCQHCDNAPCENVCPVVATTHSSEGLNQMTYNRCVGTRYCENNCPYKVRRFNWFDYTNADVMKSNLHDPLGMTDDLKRMVLNPDVTVRAKGVIEKCSFCSQRIQEKKMKAKLENRALKDGEIQPACSQSCPANAIVFGDLNDKNSEISRLYKSDRKYRLLEEIHTEPSIGYLKKVRNV